MPQAVHAGRHSHRCAYQPRAACLLVYVEQLILYPGSSQVLDFADGRVRLVGVKADRDGLLVGQRIATLKEHIPNTEARIAAIYRQGKAMLPDGDTVIQEGDEVFFIADRKDIRVFMSEMRRLEDPVRRVVIAGGGNIGVRLALALEQTNQVKIIERDPHACATYLRATQQGHRARR